MISESVKSNTPLGLDLFSGSNSFMRDLTAEDESLISGGRRSNNSRSGRNRTRRKRRRRRDRSRT